MAASKRGSSSDQNRQNGGSRQAPRSGNAGPEGAEAQDVAHRLREGLDTARESVQEGYRRAEHVVSKNPAPSLLVGFGLGFGLGLVVCTLLTSREKTWSERYLPESLRNTPDSLRHLADQVKDLPSSLSQHIPSSLTQHLPHALRKHLG